MTQNWNITDLTYQTYLKTYENIVDDKHDIGGLFELDFSIKTFYIKYVFVGHQVLSSYFIRFIFDKFPNFDAGVKKDEIFQVLRSNRILRRIPAYVVATVVQIANYKGVRDVSFSHIIQYSSFNNFRKIMLSLKRSFVQEFLDFFNSQKDLHYSLSEFFEMLQNLVMIRNVCAHNGQVIDQFLINQLRSTDNNQFVLNLVFNWLCDLMRNTGYRDVADNEFQEIIVRYKNVIMKYAAKIGLTSF